MKSSFSPAQNAWALVLCFLGSIIGVGLALDGWPAYAVLLGCFTLLAGLHIDWAAFSYSGDELPARAFTHQPSTVPDTMLAYDQDYRVLELYHCYGTPEAYTGLDTFGNIVTVERDLITGVLGHQLQHDPLSA